MADPAIHPAPRTRWQRLRGIAIYLLVMGLVIGLALEIGVRVLGLAPPLPAQYGNNVRDEHLPYRRSPESVVKGRSRTDEFDFEYRHNSLGFRDVEHAPAKQPGVVRIVALGDSFTYGIGADYEETYLSRLEQSLIDDGVQVEIIKLGLPRFFPEAERLALEHYGLAYDPDIVLVAFLPNDVVDTHWGIDAIEVTETGYLREKSRLGPISRFLYMNSEAARIPLKRWAQYLRHREKPFHFNELYRADGPFEDSWLRVEQEYDRIHELSRENDAAFVLVTIPQRGPWDETRLYPDERLGAWAARNDVLFVPTLPALREAGDDPPVYWREGHCTPLGYSIVADTIRAALIEQGLVDPGPDQASLAVRR